MSKKRAESTFYLLGHVNPLILGSKLPSNRQALGLYLHYHFEEKNVSKIALKTSITEVMQWWLRARIPTPAIQHCQAKLEKLVTVWKGLKKCEGRTSEAHRSNEESFVHNLDDLFDIAHVNALEMINIQEDRDFLLAQREKGRRGTMAGFDATLASKEARAAALKDTVEKRKRKVKEDMVAASTSAILASSGSSSATDDPDAPSENLVARTSQPKRGRKTVISPDLAASLDRSRISDRAAMSVVGETARSLGHEVDNLALNRSTIRRLRQKHRQQRAIQIKEEFKVGVPLVVHWDGKLIPDLTGKEKVDRLPVIVSGEGVSQLLAVPKLATGTGQAQADAVAEVVRQWGVEEDLAGMCFDTTASNTGRLAGACVLLEQELERPMLWLACRHHVLELVLAAVFTSALGSSSGPDILPFKAFQTKWRFIDQATFSPAPDDEELRPFLEDIAAPMIEFCNGQLEERQPRDDYKELLELIVVFLGGKPRRGIHFRAPGAMHQARWMAKAIYALKMWLFRVQLQGVTAGQVKGLRKVSLFVALLYGKEWTLSPKAASAPRRDLGFIQQLLQYERIDEKISKAATKKFATHLWYLSEEMVGLALFDDGVDLDMKRKMVSALFEKEGEEEPAKRVAVPDPKVLLAKSLDFFVSTNTKNLFHRLRLPDTFLHTDPEEWEINQDYQTAKSRILHLAVVNDRAERGVALIQDLNGRITRNEDQLQFLVQVVADHRKRFPDASKKTMVEQHGSGQQ